MTVEHQRIPQDSRSQPGRRMTRRQLLRTMTVGTVASGAALAAGGSTVNAAQTPSAAQPTSAPEVDVTLQTGGWPFAPMPSAEERQANPQLAAYAEALQGWLDLNPGVQMEQTAVDVWNQEALVTAVTGGTAPAWYPGDVLGGWSRTATFAAFTQGLAADTTDLGAAYDIDGQIADYAKPAWASWSLNDRLYGAPASYVAGNGIYFRRDLITEAGLTEPQPGWTWEDFRALAKGLTQGERKGAAMQQWGIDWPLNADGFELLTEIPAPDQSWHWRADYTSRAEQWVSAVQLYRDMVFTDQSILSDITFSDPQVTDAFSRGAAAMFANNSSFFTAPPSDPTSVAAMADRLGKPIEEVVGWIQHPVGATQVPTNTYAFVSILSFSPELEADALDKAFSLYHYMNFGPGFTQERQAAYQATQDLRLVWNSVTPINGVTQIEGVPGTAEDAWGTKYMDAVRAATMIPLVPDQAQYFPPEQNPGPTDTASDDMLSRWAYEPGDLDIAADLQQLEDTVNAQFAGFASSVSREDFIAGARAYYAAHAAYWEQHAPEFYSKGFTPWYDEKIAPALEG